MARSLKQAKSEAQAVAGRRSTRLSISIPITISGTDASGQAFRENARTLVINNHGAKLATVHHLILGSEVTVENRALGRTARANIVWTGDRRSPKDIMEVGIQLLEAQNIWGIQFPPDDWQEGPPIGPGGKKLEKPVVAIPTGGPSGSTSAPNVEAQASEAAPVPILVAADPAVSVATEVEEADLSPARASVEPIPMVESSPVSITSARKAGVSRLAQMAEEAAEAQLIAFEEKLAQRTNQFGFQTQASLEEAAKRLERKMLSSLEQQVSALTGRLQASRGEIESLLARVQELQEKSRSDMEKAPLKVHEASGQALQSVVAELKEKVRMELEAASSGFVEQARGRILAEASAAPAIAELKEKVRAELEVTFSHLVEEARGRIQAEASTAPVIEDLKGKMRAEVEAASSGIVEEARKRIRSEAPAALEAFKTAEAEGYRKKLADLSATALKEFQHQTAALHDTHHGGLQETLQKSQEKTAQEVSDQLEKTAQVLLESLAKDLDRHCADTLVLLSEELRAEGNKVVDEADQQLRTMIQSTLDSLTREANSTCEDYRGQLRKAFAEVRDQNAQDLQSHLEQALEKAREAVLEEIRSKAEESGECAVAEIKSRTGQLVRDTSDVLNKQVGAAAIVLREWEELAKSRLDTHWQKVEANAGLAIEALRKQSEDVSQASLEKLRKESNDLVEGGHDRAQQATRVFQDKSVEATHAKLQAVTEQLLEAAAAQLRNQAEASVDLVTAQLREKQQQTVNDAENLFRNSIADVLKAVIQPVPKKTAEPKTSESEPGKKRR